MIDLIASQPQYAAHLDPVWDALPAGLRGIRLERRDDRVSTSVLVASISDLAAGRRLGYERIAYLEHGIGQSYGNGNAGYPGGHGRDAVDLFLSPNATAAAMDRAAYPAARVEVVGDPRLDTLPSLTAAPGTVAISFHWPCGVAPETRPAFPHYRAAIADLAAAVPLIGHAHPRARASMEIFYGRLGIEFVDSFDEVCRRASVYVCDNSSTLFEFASTGRPVVILNAPWYRRDVRHGLRFWEAATVGMQVNAPDRLVETVEYAIREAGGRHHRIPVMELRRRRERALDLAYAYRSGAGARAAAAIVEWLGATEEVAA